MTAWTYKGWDIDRQDPPIPVRSFDWCATSPDYEVDMGEDGPVIVSGEQLHAATYEELLQEIEDYLAGEDA